MSDPGTDPRTIAAALAAPFDAADVKWKPAVISGNRALAIPYVDARAIMDRLDEVLGVAGWEDAYEPLPDGSVLCRLRLLIGEQWITKMDVGGKSDQPDEGDKSKAAVSDALKRAGVKFGIGRSLARLPQQWCDYDGKKREFARTPVLPASYSGPPPPTRKAAPPRREAKQFNGVLPANGADLDRRLTVYDARLAAQGVCQAGELLAHVRAEGVKAGEPEDLTAWGTAAIALAVEATKEFEAGRRKRKPAA
jgi:hypothetical protein